AIGQPVEPRGRRAVVALTGKAAAEGLPCLAARLGVPEALDDLGQGFEVLFLARPVEQLPGLPSLGTFAGCPALPRHGPEQTIQLPFGADDAGNPLAVAGKAGRLDITVRLAGRAAL